MWTKLRQSYQLHGSSVKDKEGTSSGDVILKKVTGLNQSLSGTSVNRRRQMGNSASIKNASPVKQLNGSGSQSSGIATDESGTMDSSPLNSDTELSTPEISQKSQDSPPVSNAAKDNSALKNHFPLNCCWDTGSQRASLVGADILKVDEDDNDNGTLKNAALEQDIPLDTQRNRQPLLKNLSRDSGLVPSDNEKSPTSPHKPLNGRSASLDSGNALTPTRTLNTGLPQWPSSPPSSIIQGKSKSCYEIGSNLRKCDLALSPTNVKYAGLAKSCSSVNSISLSVVPQECIIPTPCNSNNVDGENDSEQSLALSAKSGEMFVSTLRVCGRIALNTNSESLRSNANPPHSSMSAQALNVHGLPVTCKPHTLHQNTLPRSRPRTSDHSLSSGRRLTSDVSAKLSSDIHSRNLPDAIGSCALTETSATSVEEGCPDALPGEPACSSVTTPNTPARHRIIEALNRATVRHNATSLVASSTKAEDRPSSPPHQEHKRSGAPSGRGVCSDMTGGKVASLECNPSNDITRDAAVPAKQESVVAVTQQAPLPWVMGDTVEAAAPTRTLKVESVEKQPSDEAVQDNYETIIQEWEVYLQNALPRTKEDVPDKSAQQPCKSAAAAAAGTGFAQLLELVRFLECISRVYDERARSRDFRAQQLAGQAVPGTKKATEVAHTKVFSAQDSQNRIAKMKTLPMAQELYAGLSRKPATRNDPTLGDQPNAVAAGAIPKRRHHTLWPASAKRHSDPNLRQLHVDPSLARVQSDDCIDGAITLNRHHSRAPWKSLRALFKRSKAVKHSHSGDSTYSRSEEVDDIKETEEFSAAS